MNDINIDGILDGVRLYYTAKIIEHGATHKGVDWNSYESQTLRYSQLLKVYDSDLPFSINDYGCGYGGLAGYMTEKGYSFGYSGLDISSEMIAAALKIHKDRPERTFFMDEASMVPADYTLASGIFNVKQGTSDVAWEDYVLHTLRKIDALSRKGFAVNMLTSYSDPEFMRKDLYYADPKYMFDYCMRNFSRFVSILHDYPLYEFTILVKKP